MDEPYIQEIDLKARNGMGMLIFFILLVLADIAAIIVGGILSEGGRYPALGTVLLIVGLVYFCICWVPFLGLKILKPKEALVLTLFGKYIGTLRGEGFFFVNPFSSAVNPAAKAVAAGALGAATSGAESKTAAHAQGSAAQLNKKISLKAMTLNNDKQKINDALGNPIIIGIVVIWQVVNAAKAVFNVDNYIEYLSIQADAALRNVVRLYPYDISEDGNEKTLRGSSQEVAEHLKVEIQGKVSLAGIEIIEARITHLSYAPEIAAVMLQRQQASAIIDARKMIVEGAVSMVEMALDKLSQKEIVQLDEERKAAMVSNLLVILCGNRDAQPVVNSGSIY